MKRQGLFAFVFIFSAFHLFAQRPITCSSERNSDNSISIYADAQVFGEYTLKFTFTELRGYNCSLSTYVAGSSQIALTTVIRGRREVAKLIPEKTASSHAFNYRYSYYAGPAVRRVPDSNFIYLLPASPGTHLQVTQVSYFGERFGQKASDDFRSIGFTYHLGDTICASRAGTVYECSDDVKEGEKGAELYKSDRNRIAIQQKDGTIAHYAVLSPIQLLIAAGDYVVPGQPIAVFNKESEKYRVLFSVFYLDEKKTLVDNTNSNSQRLPSAYSYLSTAFYLNDADRIHSPNGLEPRKEYTATHPKEIIATELSKKDKKKLGL